MYSDEELRRFLREENVLSRVRAEQWSAARTAQRMIASLQVHDPQEQKVLADFFSPVRASFVEEERRRTERRYIENIWILPQIEENTRLILLKEERILRNRIDTEYFRFYEEKIGFWYRNYLDAQYKVISDEAEARQMLVDDQILGFTVISLSKRLLHLELREADYRKATIEVLWESGAEYIYASFLEELKYLQPSIIDEEEAARKLLFEQQSFDFTALVYYESCKLELEGEETEYRRSMIEILWLSGFEFIVTNFMEEKDRIRKKEGKPNKLK